MEIKKGDRFRCIKDCNGWYTPGKVYVSNSSGRITRDSGEDGHFWDSRDIEHYFVKETSMIRGLGQVVDEFIRTGTGVPKSKNPIPPPPKPDSPTSPSHYKAYEMESIEMMIRIWGKQRVAE